MPHHLQQILEIHASHAHQSRILAQLREAEKRAAFPHGHLLQTLDEPFQARRQALTAAFSACACAKAGVEVQTQAFAAGLEHALLHERDHLVRVVFRHDLSQGQFCPRLCETDERLELARRHRYAALPATLSHLLELVLQHAGRFRAESRPTEGLAIREVLAKHGRRQELQRGFGLVHLPPVHATHAAKVRGEALVLECSEGEVSAALVHLLGGDGELHAAIRLIPWIRFREASAVC
eukprot:scaffold149_cov315-Pinguiococcus_pyrenoidosus.AAC.99